ncbi:MAG: tripartite tricarboxylate transporter substrate binding protein [Xanthobacteraceae bacterium]|nr:tripartite tricarboxylate transporter substrate binding protein [Xanthobacteraceae bacterium]
MRFRSAVVALGAALLVPMHGARAEEAYPSRSIRLIVPYGAGGASDVMARYFGQKLAERWKATVVIENMAAAAGTIAYTTVARAPADGYTLVYGTSSIAVNAALRTKSPYDPVKDFRPISSLLAVQNVLVVPMSLPVKSVAELVALAKQKPGALNYVSLGPGSSPHLSMELFRSAAGITVQQVPYKQTTQAYTDLIDGRVQLWLASMPSALPFIQSGKIRALAVAGPTRSVALPDVPTLVESGVQAETTFWHGIFAPAAVAPDIAGKLNRAVHDIVAQPEAKAWYLKLGAELGAGTPEHLADEVRREMEKWTAIAKQIGIQSD